MPRNAGPGMHLLQLHADEPQLRCRLAALPRLLLVVTPPCTGGCPAAAPPNPAALLRPSARRRPATRIPAKVSCRAGRRTSTASPGAVWSRAGGRCRRCWRPRWGRCRWTSRPLAALCAPGSLALRHLMSHALLSISLPCFSGGELRLLPSPVAASSTHRRLLQVGELDADLQTVTPTSFASYKTANVARLSEACR